MTDNEMIGAWISAKRKESGFTQQYIADRLHTTKATVSRWESGKRTIYAKDFIDYCHAIGMTSDEIQEVVNLWR